MANFRLSRRTMLRGMMGGASVAVALPMLEAMLNTNATALADGTSLPLRFMTFYWADGITNNLFEPIGVGPSWTLNEQAMALEPVKDYLNFCTGLENRSPHDMTHHAGMSIFSGYTVRENSGFNSDVTGPTIDQVIADTLAGQTPIRSVQVQVSKRESTDGDGGTTYLALSHRGTPDNLTPLPPSYNPQSVWKTLFGEFVPKPDDRALRRSVLDFVREDTASLKNRLGMRDKQRLDAHLEGVYELEQKITAAVPACVLPDMPSQANVDVDGVEPLREVNLAMADLIRYAFVCDLTRVASVMFKHFVSSTIFIEADAQLEHHQASHLNNHEDFRAGVHYQMERFADLLQLFRDTEEADGSNLLDSTIIYASTEVSAPWSHEITRQPIILAGHGRGYLRYPGVHYQAIEASGAHGEESVAGNTSDVLLACLQAFDPDATSIGDDDCRSETPLTDILA